MTDKPAKTTEHNQFSRELATYRAKLPDLLTQIGKHVVICGDDVLGTYDTYNDALNAGYSKYGVDARFLVQKINPVQTIAFMTRGITPCQA